MKVSKNFDIREFIPPSIWRIFGNWSKYFFVNQVLINIVQNLRDDLGAAITINNWHTGGRYKESGLRLPFTTTGARFSAHKKNMALDIKVSGMSSDQVVDYIMQNEDKYFDLGLKRIENPNFTRSWIHLDTVHTNENGIKIFNP